MGRSDAPREVLAAGTGAAITDTIFNPLENVKVRLQLEGQADRPSSARLYTSFVQCARRVTQEEGIVRGLWLPGLVATWIRAFASTGTRRRPPPPPPQPKPQPQPQPQPHRRPQACASAFTHR